MIISVSAAPTVDTSDLIALLKQESALPVWPDPMRLVCEKNRFQTIYDMPHDLQKRVRRSLLQEHVSWLRNRPAGILNFSPVVWCADWMRWFWAYTPTSEWEQIMQLLAQCVHAYDRIYHAASGPMVAYDGYVWRDENNSKQVSSLTMFLYRELGLESKVVIVRYKETGWDF